MEKRINMQTRLLLLLAALLLAAPASPATIELNGATLPAGNYIFDFQFINGDQSNGNNTAKVSGFAATGVTLDSLETFGTVAGTNLSAGLNLEDGPITEVQESFTVTTSPFSLSFSLSYGSSYSGPGPGDALTFTITDTSLNPIRSAGDGALAEVDITGPGSPVQTFASDPQFGDFAPEVVSSVPEPGTFALVLSVLCCALFVAMRKCAATEPRPLVLGSWQAQNDDIAEAEPEA